MQINNGGCSRVERLMVQSSNRIDDQHTSAGKKGSHAKILHALDRLTSEAGLFN